MRVHAAGRVIVSVPSAIVELSRCVADSSYVQTKDTKGEAR